MTEQNQYNNTASYEEQGKEIDLLEIIFNIYQRLWTVVLAVVVFALGAAVITKFFITPMYESTAKVYVVTKQDTDVITNADLQTSTTIVNDVLLLVKSRPILEQVLTDSNQDISYQTLYNAISVESPEDTRFMDITVTYDDPYMAEQLVNSLARVSVEQMEEVLDVKSASIVEEGSIPINPSSPNLMKNTALGALIGFLFACIIIVVMVVGNDKVKSIDDMESLLGVRCLGAIPESSDFKSEAEKELERRDMKHQKERARSKKGSKAVKKNA
jgi:capsular polysaccharide biosynthesis protein